MNIIQPPTCDCSGDKRGESMGNDTVQEDTKDKMKQTYRVMASNALQSYYASADKSADARLWIAVAGGPGSGKSTLANAIADEIVDLSSNTVKAVCIPMDGYHYSRAAMKEFGYDMKQRGSPWTFDAERMANDLQKAKETSRAAMMFPGYSREKSDPVEDQVRLEPSNKVVLVEGNYLLLGKAMDDIGQENSKLTKLAGDYHGPRTLKEEVRRWKPVSDCFDFAWFVHPCGDFEEQRTRLIHRTLQTWTDAKTEQWGGGTAEDAATRRVEQNDHKNAELVDCCRQYAHVVVDSL